jgi:endonuclease YncB( thermonuclease family)
MRESLAIVEDAKGGSEWMIFLIPSHILIRLVIAGVSDGEETAATARELILRTMVHRRIRVRIVKQAWGRRFLGSILGDSDGAVQEMLRIGLLRFDAGTAEFAQNADIYVARQMDAVRARMGIWKGMAWREPGRRNMKGVCRGIVGSSGFAVQDGSQLRTYYLTCLKTPFFCGPDLAEPWGFEAREFLRIQFVGRELRVVSTGAVPGREYAVITCDGKYINKVLLESGLAEFIEPVVGTVPADRAVLLAAAEGAKMRRSGRWSNHQPMMRPVVDLTRVTDEACVAELMAREKALGGIIEKVTWVGEFMVFLPMQRVLLCACVNGVGLPTPGTELAAAAMDYCHRAYHQTKVSVTIIGGLRSPFVCELVVSRSSESSTNVRTDLIERRFVGIPKPPPNLALPLQVEQPAWPKMEPIKVTLIWDPTTFTIQFLRGMREIDNMLQHPGPRPSSVHRGDIVVVSVSGRAFRACVRELDERAQTATVELLDFGDVVDVPQSTLSVIPKPIATTKPRAQLVQLGCLLPRTDVDTSESVDRVWAMIKDRPLYQCTLYLDDPPAVLITDDPSPYGVLLNLELLRMKVATFVPHEVPREYEFIARDLASAR